MVTLESSALWINYTVTPINYEDGGSQPWSKNNIKDLFFCQAITFLASCHLLHPLEIATTQKQSRARRLDQTKKSQVLKQIRKKKSLLRQMSGKFLFRRSNLSMEAEDGGRTKMKQQSVEPMMLFKMEPNKKLIFFF